MTDLELTQEWVNILQDKVFNKRMLGTLTRDDLDQLEYAQWCLKREQVQTNIDRSNHG